MAQLAQMRTEAFEDFYFDVCTLDYARMATRPAASPSAWSERIGSHIKGPGDTDLRFSIKDIPVIPCTGSHNIPDGECFTAPVRDSVNGVIHFNTPTHLQRRHLRERPPRVQGRQGRRGHRPTRPSDSSTTILDTDEGARYVGEFAIGFNPYIIEPMKDILFDEKIAGSLHFTPGRAYEDADNGNPRDPLGPGAPSRRRRRRDLLRRRADPQGRRVRHA